jgi:peptide deformylase
MLLKIFSAGESVLRHTARQLTPEEIRGPRIADLIDLMRETMREAPGVGLAAPQIGEGVALAVIEDRAEFVNALPAEDRARKQRDPVPFHVLINPVVTVVDQSPVEFFEGCLSVPGFAALVARARKVKVDALNEKAEAVSITAEGWYARIVQHEVDHLNGKLYIDRMEPRSFMTTQNLERHWRTMSIAEIRARLGWG